ncbi:unnamed protein product, partial [marine sediment metagenome]
MAEQKLLVGKVANILGDYELAINMGRNSGVKLGMEFAVLGKRSITDPDTRKTLGTYKYDKVRVRVTQVEENFSVASTMPSLGIGFDLGLPMSQPKLRSDVPL